MTADLIRRSYAPQFMDLAKPSRLRAHLVLWGTVAQLILGLWAIAQAHSNFEGGLGLGLLLISILFVGTRYRALNNIIHEASHHSFCVNRDDNRWMGSVCASLVLSSYVRYRREHLTHHAHLGDYAQDQDFHGIKALGLHEPLSGKVLARHILTPLIGRHLPYYFKPDLSADDGRLYQLLKFALLGVVGAVMLFDPLLGFLVFVVPYVFVFTAINYWTDCVDHAGLVQNGDDLHASRNVIVPRVLRDLIFPRNDCYHLVHHLFPHIPTDHLGQAHDALVKDRRYAMLPNALGVAKATSRKSQAEPASSR